MLDERGNCNNDREWIDREREMDPLEASWGDEETSCRYAGRL